MLGRLGARGGFGRLGIVGSLGGAGSGGSGSYLGQIATRSAVLNAIVTSNKQFNSRTSHTMRSAVSSFQVVFPNWYVSSTVTPFTESGTGAAATITAAIEFPAGTFKQIEFSGAAQGTIANGGNLTTDTISLSIPKGGQFFIRTFFNCTAGIPLLFNGVNGGVAADYTANNYTGEAIDGTASGQTDLTMGGTITDSATFEAAYRPVAIIGMTTAPAVLLLGDSRQNGYMNNVGGGSATNVPQGEWAGTIDPLFGYINASVSGDQAGSFVASHTNRVALGTYCSHIGCEYGINDLDLSSLTSSQLIADVQTIINMFPGKPFFLSTLDPHANAGNTAPANSASNTQRSAYNTALRNGTSGLTGLTAAFDIASVTESSLNSGLWGAGLSTDFLHPNSVGYPAITASGIINTALIHRP
jgi:hypothetical protein